MGGHTAGQRRVKYYFQKIFLLGEIIIEYQHFEFPMNSIECKKLTNQQQ